MRKLRPEEAKSFAWGHIASERQDRRSGHRLRVLHLTADVSSSVKWPSLFSVSA